jgi:pilus assembly protein TadC
MSALVIGASLGLLVGGPLLASIGALLAVGFQRYVRRLRTREAPNPPTRLVMLLLLVELRSGLSVLAALQAVAVSLPDYRSLQQVSRLATVSGLTIAIEPADDQLRPVIAQLARAQRSGASLSDTMRRLLDRDLATDRTRRLVKARSLPVKLMVPITLFMLPGLVLLIYAPTLFDLFNELTGSWQ